MEISVRRAVSTDAAALARLGSVMLEDMQVPVGDDHAGWRVEAEEWFGRGLASPDGAAFLAQTRRGELVAAALGEVSRHAPSPWNPSGVKGHVSNVVTEPAYRRLGLARACVEQLLAWFREETATGEVDLAATECGAGLYESLGFTGGPTTAMSLAVRRA